MFSDPTVFIACLIDTGATLFILIYYVITLSDVECDYLNAQQCCSKLNSWVIPRIFIHIFVPVLLFLFGHWKLGLCNIPLAVWLVREFMIVPQGNVGVYDPTEIHNRGQLQIHMRHVFVQLVFYLIMFFIYLYCMILALLKDSPLEKDDSIFA